MIGGCANDPMAWRGVCNKHQEPQLSAVPQNWTDTPWLARWCFGDHVRDRRSSPRGQRVAVSGVPPPFVSGIPGHQFESPQAGHLTSPSKYGVRTQSTSRSRSPESAGSTPYSYKYLSSQGCEARASNSAQLYKSGNPSFRVFSCILRSACRSDGHRR